jgi:hypothetical protein
MNDPDEKPETRPGQFLLAERKAKSAFFRTKPWFKKNPQSPESKPGLRSMIKKLLGLRG